jgi:methionyl-tRNA formyltransferase
LKLKVCIASSSLVSQVAIEAFNKSSEVDLVCIISNPDKPTGRGQATTANPLAQWASSSELTVHKPQTDEEIAKILIESGIDLLITIAYGHILSASVLEVPSYGCLNLHFSLLPKYRGAAPVQWALLNGDTKTGVTVFRLEVGMDTGPIFVQREVPISEHDTTESLLNKMAPIGVDSLQESVAMLRNGQQPEPQDSASASLAPKIMKDAGRINWQMAAATIYNQYRAIGENPGLFTELSGNRIRINEIAIDKDQSYPVGGINLMGNKLVVGTSDFAVEIKSLTPQGRKPMSGIDFYNGLRDKSGLKFA